INGNNSLRYLEFREGAFDFQTSQQNRLNEVRERQLKRRWAVGAKRTLDLLNFFLILDFFHVYSYFVFLYGLVLCEGLQLDGWFSDHGNGLDEFGVSR
ncbi:hypothetical protein ACA359_13020, partial [Enterococcus faecium]|nr:hypothetical protein [Enterococcus faecium]